MGLTSFASSGPADIVASGTVISFRGEPINIRVKPQMNLRFEFDTDSRNPGSRMHAEVGASGSLVIRLTNFNSPIGTGSSSPLKIGQGSDGRRYYLNFRVYRLGDSPDRTLQYTVYSIGQEQGDKTAASA